MDTLQVPTCLQLTNIIHQITTIFFFGYHPNILLRLHPINICVQVNRDYCNLGYQLASMQDQRRSFSFSSFDFNSSSNSAGVFSSDDDEFFASNFFMYDTEDDDDDDAYIEINLNSSRPTQTTVLEQKKSSSNSSEVELRISFSSAGIPPTCGTTQHAQGTTMTTMTKPRRNFVSLARIVNELMTASSAKTSNSVRAIEATNVAIEHGRGHLPPVSKSDCTEMIRNRKDCTMVASKSNDIMNFIVKFKYKNIPSMLVSMVTPKAKSGQMRARQPLLQRGSSTCWCRDPMNNDNRKLKNRNHSDLDYQDLNRDKSTSSSVADILNFKAIRRVLNAMIIRTSCYYTSARIGTLSVNKHNKSKSCPSSIKSSPIHSNVCDDEVRRFYSKDNCVQAAIAHCKKSFGTQAEFDFHL